MFKKTVTYIIDILIVLVILAVGLYGYKIISNKALTKNGADTKTVLITIEFEKHDKEILKKITVGEEVMDSAKNEVIGTVKSVSPITDSIVTVSDYKNGKYVKASTPEYGLQTIVLECVATVTPTDIKVRNTDIKVGTELGIRTNEYALRGRVMGINFSE